MQKIGLAAGGGELPLEFVRAAKKKGQQVVVLAIEGVASPELEKEADKVCMVRFGQLGKSIFFLMKERVKKLALLGTVSRDEINKKTERDDEAVEVFVKTKNRLDYSILEGVTNKLSKVGVEIIDPSEKRIKFILAVNPNIETNLYDHYISMHPGLDIQRIVDNTADVLAASDFAIVTSGTATLETSVSNVPFVIVYKTAALTAVLYYMFLNLPSVGLANIVAQKKVLPELLQWDVTAEKIAEEALHILDDPKHYEDIKLELSNIRKLLGEPGAAKRAAGIVAEFLN